MKNIKNLFNKIIEYKPKIKYISNILINYIDRENKKLCNYGLLMIKSVGNKNKI